MTGCWPSRNCEWPKCFFRAWERGALIGGGWTIVGGGEGGMWGGGRTQGGWGSLHRWDACATFPLGRWGGLKIRSLRGASLEDTGMGGGENQCSE